MKLYPPSFYIVEDLNTSLAKISVKFDDFAKSQLPHGKLFLRLLGSPSTISVWWKKSYGRT